MKIPLSIVYLLFYSKIIFSQVGFLDSTFSDNGKFKYDIGEMEEYDYANHMAMDNNNSIVICGATGGYASYGDALLLRLNSDGVLDSSFSDDGYTSIHSDYYGTEMIWFNKLIIRNDSKIIGMGNTSASDLLLMQFLPSGHIDTTFGINGFEIYNKPGSINHQYNAIISGNDGSIFIGGVGVDSNYNSKYELIKFKSSGVIDSAFGNNRIVFETFHSSDYYYSSYIVDLYLMPDDKIIACGVIYSDSTDDDDYFIARFNSDGSIDSFFGTSGISLIDYNIGTEAANSSESLMSSDINLADSSIYLSGRIALDLDSFFYDVFFPL